MAKIEQLEVKFKVLGYKAIQEIDNELNSVDATLDKWYLDMCNDIGVIDSIKKSLHSVRKLIANNIIIEVI